MNFFCLDWTAGLFVFVLLTPWTFDALGLFLCDSCGLAGLYLYNHTLDPSGH